MIHPNTELKFINPDIGYGVVATDFIPKGTITWTFDKLDRVFTPHDLSHLDPLYLEILEKYTFRDNKGNHILCWDNARYVNHSFQPSCITTAYDFELAVRDIYPGEELTDDYGFLNVTQPFHCLPEDNTSRQVVMPDDLLHYHQEWDDKLLSAFDFFNKVEQPLQNFLSPDIYQKAVSISRGQSSMDSILFCYYAEQT